MSDPVLMTLISAGFSFATTILGIFNNIMTRNTRTDVRRTRKSMESMESDVNDFRLNVMKIAGQKAYVEWIAAQERVQSARGEHDKT